MGALSEGGEVILFPKARDDAVRPDVDIDRGKRAYDGCHHRYQLVLDIDAHQLLCPNCGKALDPFDWIVDYVQKWDAVNTRYRQAKQQATEAEKRLLELQRVERNLKAKIRRGGLVITSVGARAAYKQLCSLGYILSHQIQTPEDRPVVERRMGMFGYKPDEARRALRELHGICNLTGYPDEEAMPG